MGLFDNIPDPPAGVDPARENNPERKDLRAEAARWIAENPDGYQVFVDLALPRLELYRPFGIGQLTEVVRWTVAQTWTADDGFKINNNHRAYIARKLISDYPRLEPLIRFRRTRY